MAAQNHIHNWTTQHSGYIIETTEKKCCGGRIQKINTRIGAKLQLCECGQERAITGNNLPQTEWQGDLTAFKEQFTEA